MLDMIFPRSRAGQVTETSDYGWTGAGIGGRWKTRAGVTVDEETALGYEAVFAAMRVIAEGVGGVPLPKYERRTEQNRVTADGLFDYMVNPKMAGGVFREGRVAHQAGWGNGFAEIERDAVGRVIALWPIHPSRVSPAAASSEFAYLIRNNDGTQLPMYDYEVLHIPGALSDDGIWGRGCISYGRECIGGGIGTARAAYGHLGSGGQPKGVLEVPGITNGQDARQKRAAFREEWNEVHGNPEVNVPTIAILGPGSKYTPIGAMSGEANQILQTRQFDKAQIATLFGIPGYKIGAESKETAGTIEQKAIEFVVYSLMPWARKWEEQCGFKLLSEAERQRYYYEHNFTALLRGDVQARYNAYRLALMSGIMTINEVRRLENLPNIGEAGDMHLVPANLTTADRMMSGDVGGGGGLGSDMSGLPADDPNDREPEATARWAFPRHKAIREVVTQQLTQLQDDLPVRKMEWVEVAKSVLTDSLSRMLTKESRAITAAAKNNDFPDWLKGFYAKHYPLLVDALQSACKVLAVAGVSKWERAEDLAAWLKARSMEAAQKAWNEDTPTVFARRLEDWPKSRVQQLIEEIMQ